MLELYDMNDFINVKLSKKNIDRFHIRSSIFKAIKNNLNNFKGSLLDVGCGKMPYKEYILKNSTVNEYVGLDIENALLYDSNMKPDYTWDGLNMPFQNDSFETCIATEVLEHCPKPDLFLKECYRVLKSDGIFFFTVPFLWNLHEVPNDEYRYTPFSLERHLTHAGFKEIKIYANGGWHSSMAQMLGLWLKRSPMSTNKRKLLIFILFPFYKYLITIEQNKKIDFKEGQMIPSFYGTAKK